MERHPKTDRYWAKRSSLLALAVRQVRTDADTEPLWDELMLTYGSDEDFARVSRSVGAASPVLRRTFGARLATFLRAMVALEAGDRATAKPLLAKMRLAELIPLPEMRTLLREPRGAGRTANKPLDLEAFAEAASAITLRKANDDDGPELTVSLKELADELELPERRLVRRLKVALLGWELDGITDWIGLKHRVEKAAWEASTKLS